MCNSEFGLESYGRSKTRRDKTKQSTTLLRGSYALACPRSDFLVLSQAPAWDFHAPAWATNMSPIFVYFKAHPRGFELGL